MLASICGCNDRQGEVRAQIGDPQERSAYIEFLKGRDQRFTELPDGVIVVTPRDRSDAAALELAVKEWQKQRVELLNGASSK